MIRTIRRGRFLAAAAVLATAVSLAGCATQAGAESPATTGDSELDALVAAAQKEGSVSFYTGADPSIAEAAARAFQEKYGIQTTYTRLAADEMIQRFEAELDADAVVADVVLPFNDSWIYSQLDAGAFQPLEDADIPGYPDASLPESAIHEGTASFSTALVGFEFNTEVVAEDDVPTSWAELLDSKWSGQILASEPVSTLWRQWWTLVVDEYGIEYAEEFASQVARWYPGVVPATEALAAGEGALVVPGVPAVALGAAAQGAPVSYVFPDDVPFGTDQVIGLVADAPHPNAARLLAHFLLSEEGRGVYNSIEGIYDPSDAPEGMVRGTPELADRADQDFDVIRKALGL